VEESLASDIRQALHARRSGASVYLSLSERVGLPLALLGTCGRPHVLLAHHLTSARKRALQQRTGYLHRFDRVVVFSTSQEAYLLGRVGLPAERVRRVSHNVDAAFWMPQTGEKAQKTAMTVASVAPQQVSQPAASCSAAAGYVLSVGRERRDYATLVRAVSSPGANVPTIIVASSPWSRSRSAGGGVDSVTSPPANVSWQGGLRFTELRDLYEKAALVVVPLEPGTEYAAGSTGLMEAMAMSKAVVVTDTPGIADYVSPGKTARVVPGGDPVALREAITQLLANPVEAERLGTQARQDVLRFRTLDSYVEAIASIVREVLPA
jgi:glycosyltransferase involved in cell wall biosynthesis